jgi:hypothetical protein
VLRRLELLVSPLESMFFALTEGAVSSALDRDELTDQLLAAVGR